MKKSLLIFYSNTYVYFNSVHGALRDLAETFEITLCLFDSYLSDQNEMELSHSKEEGVLKDYFIIRLSTREGAREVQRNILNTLGNEVIFWSGLGRQIKARKFDGVLLHSESFLSDFVSASLCSEPVKVIVYYPELDSVQSHLQAPGRMIARLKQIVVGLRHRQYAEILSRIFQFASASLYIRTMGLTLMTLKAEPQIPIKVARWGLNGRNFSSYLVGDPRALNRIGAGGDAQVTLTTPFQPFASGTDAEQSSKPMVVLTGFENDVENVISLFIEDLTVLLTYLEVSSIDVRSHPRFRDQGATIVGKLRSEGLIVQTLGTEEEISSQLASHRVVIGVSSSALAEAVYSSPEARVVGLERPTRAYYPNLELDNRIFWFQKDGSKRLLNDYLRGDNRRFPRNASPPSFHAVVKEVLA